MSPAPRRLALLLGFCALAGVAFAARPPAKRAEPAAAPEIDPNDFRSAIVIDAATGRVLAEINPDVQNPPASVAKLMTFLVVADKIKAGELALTTPVTIPREAAKMGGSEAWLMDKEVVPVEELLYLLMVQSANDAAMALAIQAAGSRDAFVDLMNARARALGMTHTVFHSPHGLPPGRDQEPDLTTARDLALLARELISHTDILRYTSTRSHEFRHANGVVNKFENHDHLLASVPGCDGLKTGWYAKAGYSIAATVQRNGRRVIAVVLGCPQRVLRDTITTRLIERGFAALPPAPVAPAPAVAATAPAPVPAPAAATPAPAGAAPPAASGIKLVPLSAADKQALEGGDNAGGNGDDTVHVDLAKPKK
ncbi:MAG TPA: D-alanyl-D-alanine carboxypeptidase family protein [Opitutaceae bacterium]|nr:D-alanyl-D-alanine carboxypeptidase family protein [Opitutaceae bacterium]